MNKRQRKKNDPSSKTSKRRSKKFQRRMSLALRSLYSDYRVSDLVYTKNPLLEMIGEKEDFNAFKGAYISVPLHYSGNKQTEVTIVSDYSIVTFPTSSD